MTIRSNPTPLDWPLRVRFGALGTDVQTIGDAASFITRLPKQYDGRLHWTFAGSMLEAAARQPENAGLRQTATEAMENALATDGMLVENASA